MPAGHPSVQLRLVAFSWRCARGTLHPVKEAEFISNPRSRWTSGSARANRSRRSRCDRSRSLVPPSTCAASKLAIGPGIAVPAAPNGQGYQVKAEQHRPAAVLRAVQRRYDDHLALAARRQAQKRMGRSCARRGHQSAFARGYRPRYSRHARGAARLPTQFDALTDLGNSACHRTSRSCWMAVRQRQSSRGPVRKGLRDGIGVDMKTLN